MVCKPNYLKPSQTVIPISSKEISNVACQPTRNISLFHLWISFGYYFLCIPFKPFVSQTGRISLLTNKIQKVYIFIKIQYFKDHQWILILITFFKTPSSQISCLYFVWVLDLVFVVSQLFIVIQSLNSPHQLKAARYFEFVRGVLKFAKHVNFLWIIVSKKEEISKLLKILSSSKSSNAKPIWVKVSIINLFFGLINTWF